MRLNGRIIMLTGAAQGIGAQYARALAAEGATLALCDVQTPKKILTELRAKGHVVTGGVCDVTDPDAVRAFVAKAKDELGTITGLVNNAAIFASTASCSGEVPVISREAPAPAPYCRA